MLVVVQDTVCNFVVTGIHECNSVGIVVCRVSCDGVVIGFGVQEYTHLTIATGGILSQCIIAGAGKERYPMSGVAVTVIISQRICAGRSEPNTGGGISCVLSVLGGVGIG